jgi:transposase
MVRIALTVESRKSLVARLQQAYGDQATRLIGRIHALLGLADRRSVFEVAQVLGVGEQTVRDWLHSFVLDGLDSLLYRVRPGRPPKATDAQHQELRQLVAKVTETLATLAGQPRELTSLAGEYRDLILAAA